MRRAASGGRGVVIASVIASGLMACGGEPPAPPGEPGGVVDILTGAGPRGLDREAQSDLVNALVAAKVFFIEQGSYEGWDPEAAALIEPTLEWAGDGPAARGVVSINVAGRNQVVMSTMSQTGQSFCIADALRVGTARGRTDARGGEGVEACSGGW